VGEFLYLAAVAILWYLIGRFLDHRRGLQLGASYESQKRKTVVAVLTLGWGMALLALGMVESEGQVSASFRVEARIICALFFSWGFLLVAIATRELLLAGRRKEGYQASTD
jgi:hypothetical protein